MADKSVEYQKLISKAPAELEKEQLYNRVLTLWDTPYRQLQIPTSKGIVHIVVSGPADAEPLILLHGMNADATMWYPNVKALSAHYRIYAVDDILGTGLSQLNQVELSQSDDSIGLMNAWYFEVFDKLNLDKVTLIGASQGGWRAAHLAISQPDRVKQLILLSPAQTFSWLEPSMDILSNILFVLDPEREDLRSILNTLSSNVDGIDQLYIDHFFRTVQTAPISPLLMDMRPFNEKQLAKLSMPVLFMAGDDDLFNSQSSVDRALQTLPCVKAELVTDSGHFISVDQADLVNQKILDFVALGQACSFEKL